MDYSRDPTKMELSLLDTILTGVGCISSDDRDGVLVAREGEWMNLLERFRSSHAAVEAYDDEYTRMIMLRNVAVVGERIVKVARAHVKQQLAEAVREATSRLPPEVLENEARLYQALEEDEVVEGWTKAMRHMEVCLQIELFSSSVTLSCIIPLGLTYYGANRWNYFTKGQWKYILIPTSLPNAFVSEILRKPFA